MKIKMTVLTPKNQASKSIENQKKTLIGLGKSDRVIEQKLINDHQFYWIIQPKDQSEYEDILKKAAKGEVTIKAFYRTIIKWISRANKLCKKFGKANEWIKRWIVKQLHKQQGVGGGGDDLIAQIEAMNEQEIKEFIEISDLKEMQTFLQQELFTIEIIEP